MHREILKNLSMVLQIYFKPTNKKKWIWTHLHSRYRPLNVLRMDVTE
jgi:hypothetical protein